MLDIAISGTALIMTAPVIAVAAAAIKLDSPGPIVFSQTRVGRHGRMIRTLKLRTMVNDARRSGPEVTRDRDPRITRVGRLLRKTKLDELPQLWNVLRGDMSIVGPRPEVPRYVELYRPEWLELLQVRPGLTDLASLTFRDEEALLARANDHERAYRDVIMPIKLALALEGVERRSFAYDLQIVARTLMSIAFVRGSEQRRSLEEAARRIDQLNQDKT